MKTANKWLIPLAFVVATAPYQLARATVIVDQPLDPSGTGEYSNLGPSNQQVADDFLLTESTVLESLSWFGRYGSSSVSVANPVAFSVRFFADAGGSPATSPTHDLSVDVNAVGTGLDLGGIPWFSYGIALPALVFAPGSYWVSVVENDPDTPTSGDTQWLWADTDTTGLRATRLNDTDPWSASSDVNHAFTLSGTTIPEPSSLLLLSSALLMMGFTRRRSSASK